MKRRMSRSTFLLGVSGAAALATFRLPASEAAQTSLRNVLWVVDDDHPQYMTATMIVTRQKIRDPGIDFTLGSTDIPLCGPARVSLLTGLSVTTHKCDTNRTWPKFRDSPLQLQERTVARYLKDAGYATGHFGKYVNGHASTGKVPPYWDRWCETKGDGSDSGGDATTPNRGNADGTWIDLPAGLPPSVWAARRCADFVRARVDSPWFAQYCPTIPHHPYTPTSRSKHLHDGPIAMRRVPSVNEADRSDKPRWMRDLPLADTGAVQDEYEGKMEELADLDYYGIRPILAALEATGQLANTLIFFTSDNGYLHGEHRERKKDLPYWESAEVPFFVKGPGVRSGATSKALVNHTDLMPTTCEIAGVPFASLEVDGRSIAPYLNTNFFSGWRKRMLVSGSDDVGPQLNPGGSDDPSGRWWLLRDEERAFILRENGAKELYWMGPDPCQERSKAHTADLALIEFLTNSVKAIREASGETRRQLEEAL